MTNWPQGVDRSKPNWTGRVARTYFKGRYVMPRIPFWRMVIASLLAFNAQAAVIATSDNGGGGQIILTDAVCKVSDKMRTMLGYNGEGEVMQGCWFVKDNQVIVVWADGDLRKYPVKLFDFKGMI